MSNFDRIRNTARDGTSPRLENWRVYKYIAWEIAEGDIYNDTRWADGTRVYTSEVKSISEDKTQLQTQNTLYVLGQPAAEPKSENV